MNGIESLFFQTLSEGNGFVLILVAFLGGIVSSLLPCTLGMMPILIGYIGGYGGQSKTEVLLQAVLFVVGISLVMSILGVTASLLGMTFGAWLSTEWYIVFGLVALALAGHMAGLFHIPFPSVIKQMPDVAGKSKWLAPIVLGMAFGATSSPCGTPYLTAILGLISQGKDLMLGATALFAYALGQGLLLVVVGLFTGLIRHMAILRRVGNVFNMLSALVFALAGILLIAQGMGWLSVFTFIEGN